MAYVRLDEDPAEQHLETNHNTASPCLTIRAEAGAGMGQGEGLGGDAEAADYTGRSGRSQKPSL